MQISAKCVVFCFFLRMTVVYVLQHNVNSIRQNVRDSRTQKDFNFRYTPDFKESLSS